MIKNLFRGKRTDNKEWVYGYYVEAEKLDNSGVEHYIIERSANGNSYPVAPKTVGRHTELKDVCNTPIYEGDIVDILTENEELGVIGYGNGGFVVNADGFAVDFLNNINGSDVKVISNIHDNPEMVDGWWEKRIHAE